MACVQVVEQKEILHSLLEDVALLHGMAPAASFSWARWL